MSDLLSIGASGLRSYRAALNAVGENVANANTDGYTRRSVRIGEVSLGSKPSLLYRNTIRFDGSQPLAVERATDAWRTADARATAADASRASTVADWLSNGEDALGSSIAPALTAVFTSGDRLTADPQSAAPRLVLLDSIRAAAQAFRDGASGLARVADGIDAATADERSRANASLTALTAINRSIARQQPGTAAFAMLADQRDTLIDALALGLGATAQIAADGTATLTAGPRVLLDRTTQVSIDASSTATTGTLAGLADAGATIAARIGELDTLAARFATTLNDWQAAGRRPDGTPGQALIAGNTAATLALTGDDPASVAAADATAPNGNALALGAVRSASAIEAQAAALIARQASATAAARTQHDRATGRRDTAAALRDVVEGIDLDTEAADLLRYQQAYQGSAKIIQAARDTVDAILALFR